MKNIEDLKKSCESKKWQDIGEYLVGDAGEVISKKRVPRVLKPFLSTTGYHYVSLMVDGKPKKKSIHRLVMGCFSSGGAQTVNHKNGIKTDNRIENLEWNSFAQNNEHARELRLNDGYCENHYRAKLRNSQVVEIMSLKGNMTHQAIADRYGVGRKCITKILNGQRWKRIETSMGDLK